jgi:hypothetical protein
MFEQGTGTADAQHRGFFARSGDVRQVWARDVPHNAIFYLPDGGVNEEIRTRCEAGELRCPLQRCPDSRLIARGGEQRRHHFAHRVAHTRHVATAIWRREAAEMLAAWASRLRGADVSIAERETVADVLVRSQRSGREVTLRVTYDRRFDVPLDEILRPERQVVLGHTRGLLLPRKPHARVPGAWWCGEPRLASDIVLVRGFAVAVNPEEQLIGTVVASRLAAEARLIPEQRAFAYRAVCLVAPLSACRLDADGIHTPFSDAAAAARKREQEQVVRASPRPPTDPQRAEYLRRAEGLGTEERLRLLREMFLRDDG